MDKALKKTLISLVAGLLVIGLIYLYIYIKNNPSSGNKLPESWIETEAVVTGQEVIMNENWLNLEYTDKQDTKYKTKIKYTDRVDSLKIIKIRYNPENPKEVVLESTSTE